MARKLILSGICMAGLVLGACTTTGNTERNALFGTGLGAGLGAIIGNNTGSGDAETGAIIGGVVGGLGGAYSGYVQDQRYYYQRPQYYGPQLHYDYRFGRYYYVDPYSGRTYWQNGQYRY